LEDFAIGDVVAVGTIVDSGPSGTRYTKRWSHTQEAA
jgi:hypothetical protein